MSIPASKKLKRALAPAEKRYSETWLATVPTRRKGDSQRQGPDAVHDVTGGSAAASWTEIAGSMNSAMALAISVNWSGVCTIRLLFRNAD